MCDEARYTANQQPGPWWHLNATTVPRIYITLLGLYLSRLKDIHNVVF